MDSLSRFVLESSMSYLEKHTLTLARRTQKILRQSCGDDRPLKTRALEAVEMFEILLEKLVSGFSGLVERASLRGLHGGLARGLLRFSGGCELRELLAPLPAKEKALLRFLLPVHGLLLASCERALRKKHFKQALASTREFFKNGGERALLDAFLRDNILSQALAGDFKREAKLPLSKLCRSAGLPLSLKKLVGPKPTPPEKPPITKKPEILKRSMAEFFRPSSKPPAAAFGPLFFHLDPQSDSVISSREIRRALGIASRPPPRTNLDFVLLKEKALTRRRAASENFSSPPPANRPSLSRPPLPPESPFPSKPEEESSVDQGKELFRQKMIDIIEKNIKNEKARAKRLDPHLRPLSARF